MILHISTLVQQGGSPALTRTIRPGRDIRNTGALLKLLVGLRAQREFDGVRPGNGQCEQRFVPTRTVSRVFTMPKRALEEFLSLSGTPSAAVVRSVVAAAPAFASKATPLGLDGLARGFQNCAFLEAVAMLAVARPIHCERYCGLPCMGARNSKKKSASLTIALDDLRAHREQTNRRSA
jgi:hypothetical protein